MQHKPQLMHKNGIILSQRSHKRIVLKPKNISGSVITIKENLSSTMKALIPKHGITKVAKIKGMDMNWKNLIVPFLTKK
jgi:hypothetical protein